MEKSELKADSDVVGWSGNLRAKNAFVVDLERRVTDCRLLELSQVERVRTNKEDAGECGARALRSSFLKGPLPVLVIACLTQGFLNMECAKSCCVFLPPHRI